MKCSVVENKCGAEFWCIQNHVFTLYDLVGRNVLNAANMNIDQKQHPCAHNKG
jgi:hypothetical protein